jgi:hypothetical protein
MASINTFITKTKFFFSSYKWLLFPLIPIILFFSFIFVIFSARTIHLVSLTKQQKNSTHVSRYPLQTSVSPNVQVSASPSGQVPVSPETFNQSSLADELHEIATGKLKFTQEESQKAYSVDFAFARESINHNTLPDGSIEYKYASSDPSRPNIQIVKDGIVIFKRKLTHGTTISDYSDFITNPPYASQGSAYFGPDAIILANPTLGIAVVYNLQSNQVYEQYLFQATSVADYIKKYGQDITSFNPAP